MVTAAPRYESPETLKRLQQVFDDLWANLVASGSRHAAPEAAVATRDRLAQLVVQHMAVSKPDIAKIKGEILASFINNRR